MQLAVQAWFFMEDILIENVVGKIAESLKF